MRYSALILTAGLMAVQAGFAAPTQPEKAPATEKSTAVAPYDKELGEIREAIIKQLKAMDPGILVDRVEKTEWDNVYMVVLNGGQILYANKNSKYFMSGGNMHRVEDSGMLTNLTEAVRSKAVAAQLESVKTTDMITFSPKGEVKGVLYAFTDVDCGYCRKLHQEVPALNAMGIEMRYLAFPRGGSRAPAYSKMVEAWCSSDRKQAMTELKTGRQITAKVSDNALTATSCASLVENQFQLGQKIGVNGTPAIYLENGQSIPGYRPAAELAKLMGISAPPALPAAPSK